MLTRTKPTIKISIMTKTITIISTLIQWAVIMIFLYGCSLLTWWEWEHYSPHKALFLTFMNIYIIVVIRSIRIIFKNNIRSKIYGQATTQTSKFSKRSKLGH